MTIALIVDDNPLDRRIAGAGVEAEGASTIFAESGQEALQIVQKEMPDIVLTDLQMPGMDGLELVQELKHLNPALPVVLMTAHGSEEIAVKALKSGAASYIPKKNLKRDIGQAFRVVIDVARAQQARQQVFQYLQRNELEFILDYEPGVPQSVVSFIQDGLRTMQLCGENDLLRVGTALTEALVNAIDHGNLELNSELRESGDGSYYQLGRERAQMPPYRDRRVHVIARLRDDDATFSIRDEGPGFDPTDLPDPTDPENLMKASGRGLMLIRTFMDQVTFNESGNEITMHKKKSD